MSALQAVYFADVFFFTFCSFLVVDLGATSSQEILDGSSPTFQGLDCNGWINFAFIWQSLKGRCHGNQQKSPNQRFSRQKFFCHVAILKYIGLSEWQLAA